MFERQWRRQVRHDYRNQGRTTHWERGKREGGMNDSADERIQHSGKFGQAKGGKERVLMACKARVRWT